jgi:ubiquinone/menaquinone biosynthesis C-methylase UbiE
MALRVVAAIRGDCYASAMSDENEILLAGEYFLAVEGLAMIRSCVTEPSRARPRVAEVRRIIEHFDEFPQSLEFPVTEYDVESGYTQWAKTYDGPNPAIEREEPIVHAMLEDVPAGDGLDAACGTGRHAAKLAALGHRVIGVDATEAMLALAREKSPDVDYRLGRLEALPVDDESVDLVTCSLALTHVPDLTPVYREFSRVLRPGGAAITSDMHPLMTMTGGVAGFQSQDGLPGVPYVVNITHHVSEYIRAFNAAGLEVRECLEPDVTDDMSDRFPSYPAIPEATRQAFVGLPYLLIWRVTKRQ